MGLGGWGGKFYPWTLESIKFDVKFGLHTKSDREPDSEVWIQKSEPKHAQVNFPRNSVWKID